MLLFALLVGLWVTMLLLRWVWVGYYASRIWTPPRGLTQRSCYLCLTTVPGRIGSLHGRLEALASLPCHHGLVLSVPWVYGKTGQPYVIPESLHSIPRLRVYRCDDEGPGTKALAPLRNPLLPEDCVLMFCDDDTYYRPETFALLADAIASSPVFVHSMCSPSIRGYLGFGGVKEVLLPVLSIEVPDECHTVDDTFFEEAFQRLGIQVKPVEIPGCCMDCRLCALEPLPSLRSNLLDPNGLAYEELLFSSARKRKTKACERRLRVPAAPAARAPARS